MRADRSRRLIVTAGEPAGIGPDICLDVASGELPAEIVVVADPTVLEIRSAATRTKVRLVEWSPDKPRCGHHMPGQLSVLPVAYPVPDCCGRPRTDNATVLLEGLRDATRRTLAGEFDGLVTGPVQKSVINDAGIPFSGHTEFLAELTGAPLPVMLLTAAELRVALASTHIPLREVAAYLDAAKLEQTIRILERDLRHYYGIARPSITVCGLNPHAGEGGHLGNEEQTLIRPVLDALRREGLRLNGPVSADTAFTPAAGPADAILAMYHDQGLPVLKYAGFGRAVNVTLGLPIVRTSVDHGTALDLAGTGNADAGSLKAAIDEAVRLTAGR